METWNNVHGAHSLHIRNIFYVFMMLKSIGMITAKQTLVEKNEQNKLAWNLQAAFIIFKF